jgi:hypothetical protein
MEVLSKIHYNVRNQNKRNIFIRGRIVAPPSTMTRNKFVVDCPFEDDDVIWVTASSNSANDFRARFSKTAAESVIVDINGVHVKCKANYEMYDDGSVSVRLDAVDHDQDKYSWFWLIVGTSVF